MEVPIKIPMQSVDVIQRYIWKDGDSFAVQYTGPEPGKVFPPEMTRTIQVGVALIVYRFTTFSMH